MAVDGNRFVWKCAPQTDFGYAGSMVSVVGIAIFLRLVEGSAEQQAR
jgi:hypothetical protein